MSSNQPPSSPKAPTSSRPSSSSGRDRLDSLPLPTFEFDLNSDVAPDTRTESFQGSKSPLLKPPSSSSPQIVSIEDRVDDGKDDFEDYLTYSKSKPESPRGLKVSDLAMHYSKDDPFGSKTPKSDPKSPFGPSVKFKKITSGSDTPKPLVKSPVVPPRDREIDTSGLETPRPAVRKSVVPSVEPDKDSLASKTPRPVLKDQDVPPLDLDNDDTFVAPMKTVEDTLSPVKDVEQELFVPSETIDKQLNISTHTEKTWPGSWPFASQTDSARKAEKRRETIPPATIPVSTLSKTYTYIANLARPSWTNITKPTSTLEPRSIPTPQTSTTMPHIFRPRKFRLSRRTNIIANTFLACITFLITLSVGIYAILCISPLRHSRQSRTNAPHNVFHNGLANAVIAGDKQHARMQEMLRTRFVRYHTVDNLRDPAEVVDMREGMGRSWPLRVIIPGEFGEGDYRVAVYLDDLVTLRGAAPGPFEQRR